MVHHYIYTIIYSAPLNGAPLYMHHELRWTGRGRYYHPSRPPLSVGSWVGSEEPPTAEEAMKQIQSSYHQAPQPTPFCEI